MALLQEAIPTLKETTIAFTANSEFQFNRTCQFLSIINLTGEVEVSINDNDYTAARGGITYKMPPEAQIYSMRFRETAGAVANLTIATGNGDIFDNRASFAGNLPVVNAASPDDSLQVDLLAADAGLVALAAAIIANQNNDKVKRSNLTTLAGASFSRRTNEATEQTIVTGGTNTSGIIVRLAQAVWDSGAAADAYFEAGGNIFCGELAAITATQDGHESVRDIFIPAGAALTCKFTTAFNAGWIWYEVL